MSKKISVIIPFYNCEKYIEETITTLLNGINENVELIFIDDVGQDNGREIVARYAKEYPQFIKVFKNDQNMGIGQTQMRGIKEATGEYITFCFSDDYVTPEYYDNLFDVIKNNVDIVYLNYHKVDDEGNKTASILEYNFMKMYGNKMTNQPALNLKIVKAELLKDIVIPDGIYEDMAIWPTIFNKAKSITFAKPNQFTMNYRASTTSIMRMSFSEFKVEQYFTQWQYILDHNKLDEEIAFYIYTHSTYFKSDMRSANYELEAETSKRIEKFFNEKGISALLEESNMFLALENRQMLLAHQRKQSAGAQIQTPTAIKSTLKKVVKKLWKK